MQQEGRVSSHQVQRLVLLAFVGAPPSSKHQAAHWNGVRTDNRPENLRWATAKENQKDRKRHGTSPAGENNNRAVLTAADVDHIRATYVRGTGRRNPGNVSELAQKYGVTTQAIRYAVKGKTWAA